MIFWWPIVQFEYWIPVLSSTNTKQYSQSSAPKFYKPVYLLLCSFHPWPFSDWPLTLKMLLPKMPEDTFKGMAI